MSIHKQYDVSVVFASQNAAIKAWAAVANTEQAELRLGLEGVPCVLKLHLQAMVKDELDLRMYPEAPTASWISLDADLTGLYGSSVKRWDGGLMYRIGVIISRFLDAGGAAVVLHKAAGVLKSAGQFRDELARDPRGLRAWVDILITQDTETRCRLYGMPHYLGLPNIHVHSAHLDGFAAECCLRAAQAALVNSPISQEVQVPMWFTELPAITWNAEHDDEALATHLRSEVVETRHPRTSWPQTDFEMYAFMLSDLVLRQFQNDHYRLFDSILVSGKIPHRILCFEADGVCLYVTAGFGRIPALNGSVESATLYAEYAAFGPSDMSVINHLSSLSVAAHSSAVPGGVKDYEILAEAPHADGYITMPLHDLEFAPQPIALRVLCPIHAFERPAIALDRHVWCDQNLALFSSISERWAQRIAERRVF